MWKQNLTSWIDFNSNVLNLQHIYWLSIIVVVIDYIWNSLVDLTSAKLKQWEVWGGEGKFEQMELWDFPSSILSSACSVCMTQLSALVKILVDAQLCRSESMDSYFHECRLVYHIYTTSRGKYMEEVKSRTSLCSMFPSPYFPLL